MLLVISSLLVSIVKLVLLEWFIFRGGKKNTFQFLSQAPPRKKMKKRVQKKERKKERTNERKTTLSHHYQKNYLLYCSKWCGSKRMGQILITKGKPFCKGIPINHVSITKHLWVQSVERVCFVVRCSLWCEVSYCGFCNILEDLKMYVSGQGDSPVVKVLAIKMWGRQFRFLALSKSWASDVATSTPVTWEAEIGNPQGKMTA